MFDFFKRNKEYLSCEWLEYGIHFEIKGVYHCCQYFHNSDNSVPVAKVLKNHRYDIKKFLSEKKKIRKEQRKNIINKRCRGCLLLRNGIWEKEFKIKNIAISSFSKCNADCIYCSSHMNKKLFNSIPDIPVKYFLQDLAARKVITEDCHVEFGGGEPTIADEFEDIINLCLKIGIKDIKIHSSGILYSDAIEKCLKEDKCQLIISPDSGTAEMYKRIKNTDKSEQVWNNISKYALAQNNIKNQVMVKYLIIPSVNDNIDEISEFFNRIIESKVISIRSDIEMNWYRLNKNNHEEIIKILKLMKFIQEKAKELNISHAYNSQANVMIDEHKDLYDKIMSAP